MTCAEKWNFIVEKHQRLYSSLESKIQTEWEMYCSDLFGYRKLFGEIDAQRHLSVGSGNAIIPDIILCVDKKDIFDIELKQYSLPFDQHFENQLISYLNQTHLSVGMVVCNKIYLYHYDYVPNTVNKIEIPFEKDHSDGIALMDMLARETFSADKIRDYIFKKKNAEKRLLEIQSKITTDWVKELVKTKLTEDYPEINIDGILKSFSFIVTNTTVAQTPIFTSKTPSSPTTETVTPISSDISPLLREWCEHKNAEERLIFLRTNSSKKYTRFTTQELNAIIPYQADAKSGWNNGHFYAYEIENYGGKFKMFVSFSNKNAPSAIRRIFALIAQTLGVHKNEDWEWWRIFSTKAFAYSDQTSQEDIFNALNWQFEQVQRNVAVLLKNINTK